MTEILRAQVPRGPSGEKDPNDWAKTGKIHVLHEAIARARPMDNEGENGKRFHLLTPEELAALPVGDYRIKHVLPSAGVAVIYGAPKSGKTFLVLDAAGAITEGRPWFGYRARSCAVVYIGLEGQAGLTQRWQAYSRIKAQSRRGELRFVTAPLSILASGDLAELADAVRAADCAGGVVIVDTLNAASPGADENSSVDMGRIIDGAKQLQREVGGLIWLVHHSGKDTGRGLRGHSSLTGAVDAIIEVTRDESGDRREWRVERAKDGPESDPWPFTLSVVELGEDEDGDPLTSCVIEPREREETPRTKRKPPGGNQKLALKAIEVALKASGEYGQGGAPEFRPCISFDKAIEVTAAVLPVEKDRQRERARLAIQGLVSGGLLAYREEWIWLP